MKEIEKRSLIAEKDVPKLKKMLDSKAKLVMHKKLHTVLYKSPNYLRFRWEEGNDKTTVTLKIGTYKDAARDEYEMEILTKEVPTFAKIMQQLGYTKCVYFKSECWTYEYGEFRIDLTKHDYLGTILEAEKMASEKESEEKIVKIRREIDSVFEEFDVVELSNEKYMSMLESLFKDALKRVEEQRVLKVKE